MCHTDMHSKLLGFHALTDAIQTCIKVEHTAWPEVLFVSHCEKFYSKDFHAVQMSAMPFSLLRNVSQTSFWHFHTVVSFAVYNKSLWKPLTVVLVSVHVREESEVGAELQGGNCDGIDRSMAGNGKCKCIWFPLTLFSTQCTCVYFWWLNKQNKK